VSFEKPLSSNGGISDQFLNEDFSASFGAMMPLLPLAITLTLLGPTLLITAVASQVFLAKGWDTPYIVWGAGEDSQISLPYSMMATLLAAFIERPFIRSAGFRQNALLFSIRANIWSWLFGTTLAYAFLLIGPFHEGFFALHLLAVPISIAVEGVYLFAVAKRNECSLRWRPLVWCNIVSGIVCETQVVVGQVWGKYLQNRGAEVITWLREYRELTSFGVLFFCLAIFILVFFYPSDQPLKNPDWPMNSPADDG
jgi:hypothetical protein